MKTESAITRLVKLWEMLEECDQRIINYLDTARAFPTLEIKYYRRAEIARDAKRRILEAIYAELRALKTVIKLEIENN